MMQIDRTLFVSFSKETYARACIVTVYLRQVATPDVFKNPVSSLMLCYFYDWLSAVLWKDTDVYVSCWKFQLDIQSLYYNLFG